MKLQDAAAVAISCGLRTMKEAILNVWCHAANLFRYEDINKELYELYLETNKPTFDKDQDPMNFLLGSTRPLGAVKRFHLYPRGWIYWDETGLCFYGPFPFLAEAKAHLLHYMEETL